MSPRARPASAAASRNAARARRYGGRGQRASQFGVRFSANARGPSAASAVRLRARLSLRDNSQNPASAGTRPSRMPFATRLLACTASGAPVVIFAARSRAAATTWSWGTTRLTRPSSRARCAVIGSPVRIISIATFFGIWAGSRRIDHPRARDATDTKLGIHHRHLVDSYFARAHGMLAAPGVAAEVRFPVGVRLDFLPRQELAYDIGARSWERHAGRDLHRRHLVDVVAVFNALARIGPRHRAAQAERREDDFVVGTPVVGR